MQADQVGSSRVDQCQSGISSHIHTPLQQSGTITNVIASRLVVVKEVLFPACTEPNGAKLNQTERCWNEDHLTSEDKQPGGNTEVERLV